MNGSNRLTWFFLLAWTCALPGATAQPPPDKDTVKPKCTQFHIGGIDREGGTIKGVVSHSNQEAQNGLPNAFIWVRGGLDEKKFTVPLKPVVINQIHMKYTPHVSGVVVGQTVEIHNSDNTLHNVKMKSKKNGNFNHWMLAKSKPLKKAFKKPEIGTMKLTCDVHPLMLAHVHVMTHPFFAVTQEAGKFEIRGLPPGAYEVGVWHEDRRLAPENPRATVKIAKGEKKELNFKYKRRTRKKKPTHAG